MKRLTSREGEEEVERVERASRRVGRGLAAASHRCVLSLDSIPRPAEHRELRRHVTRGEERGERERGKGRKRVKGKEREEGDGKDSGRIRLTYQVLQ